MKVGDVLYEKVYMSLRPPPKISLKHEWKKESWVRNLFDNQKGKLSDKQKVKLFDRQKVHNYPKQFQIQFVRDRGDLTRCKMEQTRTVLRRSVLIVFFEEFSSSERTERFVDTVVISTRFF